MSEDSTTPDLVELWQQAVEAYERRDFDSLMSFYAPDALWDASLSGVGRFEGAAAIRSFLEDWIAAYAEYEATQQESHDFGNGVVFAVDRVDGRPAGSPGRVQELWAFTSVWVAGVIVRVGVSTDIDEARAAAERLAEERG